MTGYLASSASEFASYLTKAVHDNDSSGRGSIEMREFARLSANRFSDEAFVNDIVTEFITFA